MKFKFTRKENGGGYLNNKKITPKKSLVIGILVGGIIFGSIGVFASTYFSANQISFTPTNEEWNATNVEEAVNDLYNINNNSSKIYYLGTGTTFDLKEKVPNIDYTTLSDENFIIGTSAINNINAFRQTNHHQYISVYLNGFSLTKSYDSSTGVLTVGGNGYSIAGCNDEGFRYCTDAYNSGSAVPFVYLVLGNIE